MISRLLLPSAVRLATYSLVRTSRRIRARQIMYTAVGLPVASAVETVPHHLARGGFDGSYPAQIGEGGFAPQPLGVVFKATIKSVAALSVPMPAKETNSGATCPTSRSRCASSSSISLESASYRRATERRANLVAVGTSRGPSARRKRAATE